MNNNTTTNNDTTAATTEESALATVRRCRASQDKTYNGVGRSMGARLSALRSRMTATLVLFFCAVWNVAQAADVQFIIVNNKGKQAFNYKLSNPSTYAVDAKARSIFAENFRFYTSLEGAVADAGGSPEGTSLSGSGPFYVRYDAKSTRVGSNSSKKYLIRCRNRAGLWWYIYFDNSDRKLKMTTQLEGGSDIEQFLWQFDDGGDPYDVYITSDYADATVSGGAVSVSAVSTSNKVPYVTYQAQIASGSYDQSATSGFTMQSFFFTQGTNTSTYNYGSGWSSIWSNSVQLVGAYNGITYNYRNGYNSSSGFENTMPYYLCANGNPNASGAMLNGYQWHCFRSWRCEDTSTNNVSQIQVVSDFALFHVVNKSGDIAISKLDETPSSTLTLPTDIKSPYIDNSNYKFFNTKEEAAAYSSATTLGERETAAAAAITTLAEVTNNTVYVGYYYDKSAKPAELPALDGSSWYRILDRYGNADNYMYSKLNNNGRADNSSICNSTTEMTGSFTDDYHLWKLTGDDPYAIYLSNKWMNENKGSDSDMPIRYGGISQGWFRPMSGYYTTGYTMMLLGYDATYVNMAVVSEAYRISDYEYLYFFGANGSNGSTNVQFMRNQNTTSNLYKTDRTAALLKFIEIPSFTYHVTTPSGTELTCKVSYDLSTVTDLSMPTELQRKYISSYTFHPTQADAEEGTNAMTTCEEAIAACTHDSDGYHIYVKYTVDTANLPFTISTDYTSATWYRLKVEATAFAHLSETAQVMGTDDTYTTDYQYAFFGDPYELRVMNRAGGAGKYLGVPAGSVSQEAILPIADGAGVMNVWECYPDGVDDSYDGGKGGFKLRVFGTAASPMYCGYYNGKACYFTSAITMTPYALPNHKYTYHIIDNEGREAIKATVSQPVTTVINYNTLPEQIRSPYIADETISGYTTATLTGASSYGRSTYYISGPTSVTPIPSAAEIAKVEGEKTPIDIYIRYTVNNIDGKTLNINGRRSYNLKMGSNYAYADGTAVKGQADKASTTSFVWTLLSNDPYAVQLKNVGSNSFLTMNPANPSEITLGDLSANSFFILLGEESMTPTWTLAGGTDTHDATDPTPEGMSAPVSTNSLTFSTDIYSGHLYYHIIDKQHKVIISDEGAGTDLEVPTAIKSPLVGQYHFWKFSDLEDAVGSGVSPDVNDADATYYVKSVATEITSIGEALGGGDIHIYCTYDVGTAITFDTTDNDEVDDDIPMYMLKFYNGENFRQEDGVDGLMTTTRKAIYPYSNGDANLYVYGQERWELQLESGATTRGRWPWFVVSPSQDPYHVKIMSRQSQGKSTSHNYFYTHVVRYDDGNHVVTGVTTQGDRVTWSENLGKYTSAQQDSMSANYGTHYEAPTEYMVLSTPSGRSRLVTVAPIAIDLNDDDDTTDDGENVRQTVTSFEQYWKNYETISKKGQYSVESIENPDLAGVSLHRYQAWANARPMDPVDATKQLSKDYLYDHHWFQTISMEEGVSGTLEAGAFSFEEISLKAVLVLLDQHGWEVARMNLPNGPTDPKRAEYYEGLRKLSSPMVERYHYWKEGSKQPGYHKFTVDDYAVNADGSEYTTPELGVFGTLPDYETQGMVGNQSRDWYVTYDVKDEYASAYTGGATEATVKPSAFMLGQGNGSATKWLTTSDGYTVAKSDAPADFSSITDLYLWNMRPNFNIDREMGYRYLGETGAQEGAKSKEDTESDYYTDGKNGFDPYNVQFESARYSARYLTMTDITSAVLSSGVWSSTGSGELGVRDNNVKFNASGYDQTTLNVTNATFMVVDDGNGNMRLMPRFDQGRVVTNLGTLSTQLTAPAAGDKVGTQTTLLIKPTTYTYHIINKSGKEALRYVDKYWDTEPYVPNLPDHLKAYGATNFRYLPLSEFESEALTRGVYNLVNTSATSRSTFPVQGDAAHIYVVYDLVADKEAPEDADRSVADKGFNGTKVYNLKLRNTAEPVVDQYLTYVESDGSVIADNTSLTTDDTKKPENVWLITALNGDPYQAQLYNFRNSTSPLGVNSYDGDSPTATGSETYNTFIITGWDAANDKFELLAANSGSDDNVYGYLTYDEGPKVLSSSTRQHNSTVADNLVGFTLEPVTLTFTYKLYDLSGNLTLQGTASDVSDLTPSLPEPMCSPLVSEYHYWQNEARSTVLTSLSQTEDNTIYVSYVPLSPEQAVLKLDGSEYYTWHSKVAPETLIGPGSSSRAYTIARVGRRENFYKVSLTGRYINGYYDPYDIVINTPGINYNLGGLVQNNDNNNVYTDIGFHAVNQYRNYIDRFMILGGVTDSGIDYVEMMQKKMQNGIYYPDYTGSYQYLYRRGETQDGESLYRIKTGQQGKNGVNPTQQHGNDNMQFYFQPVYRYHVLNMQGKEALDGVEPRIVRSSSTAPQLPIVLQSLAVKRYHYYDITSFDVSEDGVYVLKSGAVELEYVSDATTHDIYVAYTNADLDKDWNLNGAIAYNMVYATDENASYGDATVKSSDLTTYNDAVKKSYMWYGTNEFNTNNTVLQTRGAYYRDGWNYDDIAGPTDEEKETQPYLWYFMGGDPYNLTVHNLSQGTDKYVYRTSDGGQYNLGVTIGTTTVAERNLFMLTGHLNGSSEPRFNLLSPKSVTSGIGPYAYVYMGRTYHDNPHRNGARQVYVIANDWAYDYMYDCPMVTVKMEERLVDNVTYKVVNKLGNVAIEYTQRTSTGMPPEIPLAIKSPYATNFQYWDSATEREDANKVTATSAGATIYVTYDADTDVLNKASLDLTGKDGSGVSYNIWANGFYFYNNSGALMADAGPEKYDDTVHEWYLEGNASGSVDPYDVRLRSKKDNDKYIELAAYDNSQSRTAMSLVADNSSNGVQSFILMNGQPGRMELLAATKTATIVSTNNRLSYLGYVTAPQLLGVGSDDSNPQYQSGLRQVQVMLRPPYSGVTYHIMNLSGSEAVQYTVAASKGDALEVPEAIRSPFATNWQFFSDEACSAALTVVPSSNADIYVTYTYDDNTRDQLQIDGEKFYNMQVAGKYIHESDGAITLLDELGDAGNVSGNLWAFNGTTAAGVDPYALHLVNSAYSDVYAGAAHTYSIDTETTMQMSDGETENFRSTFFLVSSSADGPYEMVLASGVNITDNVLACVNRHSSDEVNLNREDNYQHGDEALQIVMLSPVNKYLYKVYDRSGNLAIQAWGDGVAGEAPQIPDVIKSPLVSQFYYDVETLPYTSGVDAISVTYDFDSDKLTSPNLMGTKVYNLMFRNKYYATTSSGTDVAAEYSNTVNLGTPETGVAIWKPTGKYGTGDDIDPYCITLKHSNDKVLTSSAIGRGLNTLSLATDNVEDTYQRFILLEGTDGRYEFMAATGDEIGSTYGEDGYDMFAYLAITDANAVTLARGEAYSRGKTAIQVELVPFQYTNRYVIVNNDMYEAVTYDVKQDGGDPAQIPDGLRSPLLDLSEYEYYKAAAFSTIGSFEHPDGSASTKFVFNDATKTDNKLQTLPYGGLTIYVRYNYSQKAGGLDITGTSKYLIMNEEGSSQHIISASTASGDHRIWNNTNPANRTNNYYQWRLKGNSSGSGEDPYNIKITNVARDAFDDALQAPELWYKNGTNYQSRNQGFEMQADDYASNATTNGKYKANRFAILGHEDGHYRLMAITPFFWHSDYYDLSDAQRADAANLKQERYYTVDGRWTVYAHGRASSDNLLDMNIEQGLSIQFIPTTTHNYRFHLTTKIDGRKLEVEKPNTMARDLFALPEELLRKYCDYTVKYYVDQDDNAETQLPVTENAATKVEKTIDLSDPTTLYPYFKAIDDMSDEDKANTWVDIYIDYHARQHYKTDADDNYVTGESGDYEIDPTGMPFNVMAWDAATVSNLLNNEAYTDYLFQINSYENLTEKLVGTTFELQRKDYLYFMVLKTDNDFTNSNGQYFLRRDDTGRISWLNNDYKIYKDAAKNYKGWSYSRCAEAYRENDHSVFEEKKWLFCFAGDPYDLYIFNANSTVEETYNDITEQKEFVKTHRDHLVGYTTLENKAGTTIEYAVNTPLYSETAPELYRWGLAPGQGTNSDETFSLITGEFTETATDKLYNNPTVPNVSDSPLYWRMDKSSVENTSEVMLQSRATDNTTLDYNIQVLPYEPTKYEELRFVIRRDDEIGTIGSGDEETYLGKYPKTIGKMIADGDITSDQAASKSQEMSRFIDALPSGTVRMYTSVGERQYVKGDIITVADLPLELQRKFCTYTLYTDDYRNPGDFNVPYCSVRGELQRDGDGNIIYNSVGKATYNYYKVDEDGKRIQVGTNPVTGDPIYQGAPPTTIYFKYSVTTDKFLKQRPTTAEVDMMLANNDHIYFMDFADPNLLKGGSLAYNTGHHAYFEEEATFKEQVGTLHGEVLAEKMIWNGSNFVYDTSQKFNYCQYKTTDNRMESVPEDLKWYFVGDPYKLQIYNTQYVLTNNEPEANLCRFDPTETSFQFVVDCVHFRTPDPSFIDERKTLIYTDSDGNSHEVDNNNYGNPYYSEFYWEVVPAASTDEEAFALRFRDDNQILGYRDVFYYLAHDGIKRTYREAQSENPKAYGINLSYDEDNALNLSGKYKGYHAANDGNCAIRLMQPAKVYFSAYKETYDGNPVVLEELSEYFGVGETLTEVPRHLQRKFVKYGDLQYQMKAAEPTRAAFPFTLTKTNAYNLENCNETDPVHTIANNWVYKETDADGDLTKCRASYKFRVTYEVDDVTRDGIHLFTTTAEFANENVKPQWLDIYLGNNHWMYYDKMNLNSSKEENELRRVSTYPTARGSNEEAAGWDIGIKGLHWAFIGDPYKFTVINRRRWEDSGSPRTNVSGSDFWLGTGYGKHNQAEDDGTGSTSNLWYNYTRLGDTNTNRAYGENGTGGNEDNGNTEWSLQMCKTGGASDYFIRTSSLKQECVDTTVGDYTNSDSRNMTNDYARIAYKQFTNLDGSANPQKSDYVLETFGLNTKTKNIVKAEIRTAVAEDDDEADNDCFDANVHIYNTAGELKATLKHVELTYGDVYKAIPPVLRRYGCDYIECYQISYVGYTETDLDGSHDAAKAAKRTTINTQLQSLNNFSGDNKTGSLTTFSDATLTAGKAIVDENGRQYYEIAYVYEVNDDVAKFFTTSDDAERDEYTWSNASYQWDQVYKGTNVRVVGYEEVFDHYEYNSDGHIVNEVYKLVEKVTYKSGDNISTPAYGWVNTHDGSTQSFGDETTQSDANNQKWAFVGDPYDFEMKNYSLYLNSPETSMYYDAENGITNSNISKSHWAIAQGLQKTEVQNGKVVNVYDSNGDPVYVYYLALINDDETSDTYGEVIKYVTFDRSSDNKDLAKDEQYLYLNGAPVDSDPTGTLYDSDTKNVHPFYFAELVKYANMVIYHLVIAHQHSTDYADSSLSSSAKSTIRRHLAEYLHYKMNSSTFDDTYLDKDDAGFDYKDDDTYMIWDFKSIDDDKASGLSTEAEAEMKKGTLRDLVNDPVPNYIVQRVGVGNALSVPWYMKRLNCEYKLYQRDVLRSEVSSRPVYEEADDEWIAAGKATTTVGGVVYKVDYSNVYADPSDGRIQRTFVEDGETKRAYEIDWVKVEDGKQYYSEIQTQNGKEIKQLSDMHNGRLVLIDVVYDVDADNFRFADEDTRNQTTAWYSLMTGDEADGLVNYSFKDGLGVHPDRSAHYTNDNLWSPEGDPYGFVLHNRYSTVNNNGWDAVIITAPTTGTRAVTHTDAFAVDKVVQTSDESHNAVYEMLAGMNSYTFLMHPTSAHIDSESTDFQSYYMTMDSHAPKLTDNVTSASVRSNRSTNWMLMATPEQLLPYFDRAGYVGGLKPEVANAFTNATYYSLLQNYASTYRAAPASMDFTTVDNIRKLIYVGTFSDGKFTSTNLVPLAKGYYRIKALSTEALDGDEAAVGGLRGARYVSGYRHLLESTQKDMTASSGALPMHLLATTAEENAKTGAVTTYQTLKTAVAALDAGDAKTRRQWDEHPAMRGNIELPVAEYDPSTIFHLVPSGDDFYLETQGLKVNISSSTPILAADATNLKMSDIGGTAVTMRTGADKTTAYVSVNPDHWYELTVGTSNELLETGDRYVAWSSDGLDYAVQTTKWLLEPVGTQQDWPYNEVPLRVKVNKGDKKPNSEDDDNNYYGSLYVPFDTRLNKTIDGAFTCISPVETGASVPTTIRMTSVSQLNNMGNPQFTPAGWPVVIRTSKPVSEDGANFVELYLPSDDKTVISDNAAKICLYGEYLEKTLSDGDIDTKAGKDTWTHGRNVMVFGLPFKESGSNSSTEAAKTYYAYKDGTAVGFYTNENWYRGHATTTAKSANDATAATAHFATARNATYVQRSNRYVFNNKAYYLYDWASGGGGGAREYIIAIFDETDIREIEEEGKNENSVKKEVRWGVYDLAGRQLRTREAVLNGTWRRHLPPGMYIVNGRKLLIE